MATLVLSTVGTVLGGPIGGAIGSLIGQSIDRQLFGPGPRHGPRLNELSVQTSTYGTPIPRIYGRMRVAGSVVWATDLKESTEAQSGAKGQPEVVIYSSSASFAVALSSRAAQRIGRIWADGKLLRGEAGDFKVKTGFRFYSGTEDQPIDPLIASIEGLDATPAYRGTAMAVFEDLELAEYGNRIPFLTFEVVAHEEAPGLGVILKDASAGVIDCIATQPVQGYAAYGRSIRSAVQPLVDQFGVGLIDDGSVVRSPASGSATAVLEEDLGCSAGAEPSPRVERSQAAARTLPATLTLSYYDPARDYQAGQMRASTGGSAGLHESVELPIVSAAGAMKALAETSLARRWAQRETLALRLAPSHLGMEPGAVVHLPDGTLWTAEKVAAEAFVAVVQLRPAWSSVGTLPAEPGRAVVSPDIITAATAVALLDLPDLGLFRHDVPVLHLAACNASAGWRAVPIEVLAAGEISSGLSAVGEAMMGTAVAALGTGQAALLDLASYVEVDLVDEEHWLESRDDAALAQGANLAVLGSELIQFGTATPVQPKRFRLERLLRGRRGTEWAMYSHSAGEPFVLLRSTSLREIALGPAALGSTVEVRALGVGDGSGTATSNIAGGEAMRPPSPVHLKADLQADGSLHVSWVRRSRAGWAWLDEIEAPLGETAERYRVRIESAAASIEGEPASESIQFAAAQLAQLGAGPATVTVAQIGDHALSRAVALELILP